MCFDTSFHLNFLDISKVATYDHITNYTLWTYLHAMGMIPTTYGHDTYTLWVWYLHPTGMIPTPYVYDTYTLWVWYLHPMGIIPTPYVCDTYTGLWVIYLHAMGTIPTIFTLSLLMYALFNLILYTTLSLINISKVLNMSNQTWNALLGVLIFRGNTYSRNEFSTYHIELEL